MESERLATVFLPPSKGLPPTGRQHEKGETTRPIPVHLAPSGWLFFKPPVHARRNIQICLMHLQAAIEAPFSVDSQYRLRESDKHAPKQLPSLGEFP